MITISTKIYVDTKMIRIIRKQNWFIDCVKIRQCITHYKKQIKHGE